MSEHLKEPELYIKSSSKAFSHFVIDVLLFNVSSDLVGMIFMLISRLHLWQATSALALSKHQLLVLQLYYCNKPAVCAHVSTCPCLYVLFCIFVTFCMHCRSLTIVLSCLSLHLLPDNQDYRQSANAFLHFIKHCAKKLTYVGRAFESPLGPLELPIILKGNREFPLVSVKSALVPQSPFSIKAQNCSIWIRGSLMSSLIVKDIKLSEWFTAFHSQEIFACMNPTSLLPYSTCTQNYSQTDSWDIVCEILWRPDVSAVFFVLEKLRHRYVCGWWRAWQMQSVFHIVENRGDDLENNTGKLKGSFQFALAKNESNLRNDKVQLWIKCFHPRSKHVQQSESSGNYLLHLDDKATQSSLF